MRISPPGWRRHWTADQSDQRERCRAEYWNVTRRLGFAPTSRQLQDHTDGLYKRIRKLWGGFGAFREDLAPVLNQRGIAQIRSQLCSESRAT